LKVILEQKAQPDAHGREERIKMPSMSSRDAEAS
jgi:hypothetical protein